MGPLSVVPLEPVPKFFSDLAACLKRVDVNASVFQRPPEPLHHGVVHPSTPAVHGDARARILERLDEIKARELPALVLC
jgi:hypothetical protein